MKTTIKYIPVNQKDYTFYNSVIDMKELLSLTRIVERKEVPYEKIQLDLFQLEESIQEVNELKLNAGIQRELIPGKLNEIAEYLKTEKGIFPNTIIINISDRLELVDFTNNEIIIPDDESIVITALDGQHRLQGFKKFLEQNNTSIFEIPITIFYNSELDFQAYIFSIINSKQTKINKSLLYDLLALTKKEVDEFKLSHELAAWLQTNENSILKENFKMLGKGSGWLSQAAFIDYLMPLIHESKKRKVPAVFSIYLKKKEYQKIADFLNDYFRALISTYNIEFYSNDYIFKTSFIFGLFMKLLPYIFIASLKDNNYDYNYANMVTIFERIKYSNIDFRKGGENSGVGSSGKQNQLLNSLIKIIESDSINFDTLFEKYRRG